MAKLQQALMISAAAVLFTASTAAGAAGASPVSAPGAQGDIAHLRGSARVHFPPSPNEEVLLTVDARDLGRRDQVGFTGVMPPGEPELTRCMAPGTFFTVQSGDFTVRDADHWQLPEADRPQGSAMTPLGM